MVKHRRTEVKTEVSKKSPNDRPVECSRDDQMMDQELRWANAAKQQCQYHQNTTCTSMPKMSSIAQEMIGRVGL